MDTNDLARLLDAASYAAVQHRAQRRKGADGSPYVNHPLEVAHELAGTGGVRDLDVLIAAVLHDTVEDTGALPADIEKRFGAAVRALVDEVTDDKALPKLERKRLQVEHAAGLSAGAKLIKLGDKICNVREVALNPPPDWSCARRREYLDWAESVVAGLRGANADLERKFDEVVAMGRSLIR
jgi:guanosine-3',5'-bis(diphosphate) 3'-pyrophosphohydrolase